MDFENGTIVSPCNSTPFMTKGKQYQVFNVENLEHGLYSFHIINDLGRSHFSMIKIEYGKSAFHWDIIKKETKK